MEYIKIVSILRDGTTANYFNGMWLGTLMNVTPTDGYWVKIVGNASLDVIGVPTEASTVYSLHDGNNLISYPFAGSAAIEETIPEDSQGSIDAILGEGMAALNSDNGWVGGLMDLSVTEGYWFVTNAAVSFSYNPPSEGVARMASPIRVVPEEYSYQQSTQQAFYFVDNATID